MIFGGTLNDNEQTIDEKRQIITNTRNLTRQQQIIYRRSIFDNYRPDLSQFDYFLFKEKLKLGESLLNEYRTRLNNEVRKIVFLLPQAYHREYINHKFADQILDLTSPHIRGAQAQSMRSWQDASKIVNWIEQKRERLQKYDQINPKIKTVNSQNIDEILDYFTLTDQYNLNLIRK
ncbi:hypothetical protein IMG5_194980 [Ichthyophthirius multifiliis]|uniref:Uncharacterized protein n=1 Tax=Ichthyophthirius multifiliis TaxID=5932 RepID=G0R4V2_ICHMU|nr:hypothetical protein IMG5_194980 [Ichthyophthirius multifiliis]EGR27495.1 hypothetical protein IMG5_194980 [Ichthyophthirius multifiliis]|eukprot:XP_004024405.1 hypothetical protein IMG5_194980 [Ichthyophthirius multifiliis]